ncbi:MFS transporter [Arthrobacter sp. ZGTC131]|uniref:MFS transporter n=1 Tax=Arthrobacter sp. ZGTC131 TaxID=2058898 RepID=UPI000CE42B46|nr:MFS transporter [Arthrobacter sp. ZGTC131]
MTTSTAPQRPSQHSPADTTGLSSESPQARSGSRYSRLPELAGRGFIPLGLFARLPLAMLTVGTLTLVTSVSGSYAAGGTSAGAVGIGSAIGAPVLGALADRFGQRPVLVVAAILNALAVLVLIAAAYMVPGAEGSAVPILAAAFVAGVSCPQVGPLARVRWMALTSAGNRKGGGKDLDTALSYESTADELTFVLGPALVGILASLIAPWLPLALAAALTITLVPAFAVHRTHLAVPRRAVQPRTVHRTAVQRSAGQSSPPRAGLMSFAAVTLPVMAMVCMGSFFGSTQAALSSFSAAFATSEVAGLLYAVMGLSSAAAAISVAYWPARFTLAARWLAGAAAMAGLSTLLLLPGDGWAMVLVLLVLGLPVGPVMVTVFAIGGIVAPAGRLGTVMTALASGIVAGTAIGSSVAGQLAEGSGYSAAFLVPVAAAAALFVLGAAAAVVVRRNQPK